LQNLIGYAKCYFSVIVLSVKEHMELMQTLDDAWNSRDWETFKKRHAKDVVVYWPGQLEPTKGREAHYKESVEFFKAFDNKIANRPYKILFGQNDYTCSVADWTAIMVGPLKMPDGKTFEATHKIAMLEFCTVATWKDKEIIEERLFYDLSGMMRQLGVDTQTETDETQPQDKGGVL
jgi:hypothetical protein